MALDYTYMGEPYFHCDNDSSGTNNILGGGGGCFKGKATKKVTIKQDYENNTLNLCSSCAIRIVKDAKKHGATVIVKAIKKGDLI